MRYLIPINMAVVSARLTGIPPAYLSTPSHILLQLLKPTTEAFSHAHARVEGGGTLVLEFFDGPSAVAAWQLFSTSPPLFNGVPVTALTWSIPETVFGYLQSTAPQGPGSAPPPPPPPPPPPASIQLDLLHQPPPPLLPMMMNTGASVTVAPLDQPPRPTGEEMA
jgi:hypothetical protein